MLSSIVRGFAVILGTTLLGLTSGTGGAILLLVAAFFTFSRENNEWRTLPDLPHPAARVLAGDYAVVFVELVDGGVYRCDLNARETCWQPWPDPIRPGVEVSDTALWVCPESMRPNPPGVKPVDLYFSRCLIGMPGSTQAAAFRVLPEGRLEAWVYDSQSGWVYGFLAVPLVGILGGVIGLIVGIVRVWRRSRKPKSVALPAS